MPFKLRLKKSRHYNVASKNVYVISVELLDNTVIECTLWSDSTGLECLSNVCQRLGLHQLEFFGLRYYSKRLKFQWVDLEKPLKKQLDKYAQETYLYLGVMYYVSDVIYLQDEMSRYQFFLQIKYDIIDGRLLTSQEEAVQLASYSLQAEFGDHDQERHTTEYLKGFVLLPKFMTHDEKKLESLTEEVVLAHRNLQGISPVIAELYYIMKAQTLEGYGQDIFLAKDESNNEVQVGVSLVGVIVRNTSSQASECYNWNDVTSINFHKRTFGIECEKSGQALQLLLDDVISAKYIWKVCCQQHEFYIKNKDRNLKLSRAKEKLFSQLHVRTSSSCFSLKELSNISGSVSYHPDNKLTSIENSSPISQAEQIVEETLHPYDSSLNSPLHAESMFSLNSMSQSGAGYNQNIHSTSSLSLPSTQSSNPQLRSLLPSYRPAPDYETAVQRKYGTHSVSLGSIAAPHLFNHEDSGPFAQQELSVQHQSHYKNYFHYKNFTDLTNLDVDSYNSPYHSISMGNNMIPHRVTDKISAMSNLTVPPTHTYSTPELASQKLILTNDFVDASILQSYQFKPPPPYPYNQRSSSSTPDLASQTLSRNRHSNSSPDLLSRLHLGNALTNTDDLIHEMDSEELIQENSSTTNCVYNNNVMSGNVASVSVDNNNDVSALHSFPSLNSSSNNFTSKNIVNHCSILIAGNRSRASSTQSAPEIITSSNAEEELTNTPIEPPKKTSEQLRKSINRHSGVYSSSQRYERNKMGKESHNVGPMMMAAMNGLTLSRPDLILKENDESRAPKDNRRQLLESRLAEGLVFIEFEQVLKKKTNADYTTSLLPENIVRNRFKDVLPYEDNRVCLAPSKENRTGYINASHITVSIGQQSRFYIAAQGPLANTVSEFWQMIWEQHVQLIVMLTEIQEQGRDKCFLYWPQANTKLEFGEYVITKKFSTKSPSYVTSSLMLTHVPSKKQRIIWHIQYTDWPDHGCPDDVHGFLNFMEEVDSVRRHAAGELPKGRSRNFPVVIHCSAGVGRSGVTILTDIMLYCLDHNEDIDVPKMLAHLRQQRMLIVQTVAQYKFIYSVLIQYLKNSRLI